MRRSTGGAVQNILGVSESAGQSQDYVPYSKVMKHYGGSFSDFVSKVVSFVRPIVSFLRDNKIISTVSGLIPHPIAQTISQVSGKMGFGDGRRYKRRCGQGDGDGNGGFVGAGEGGEIMSREDLLNRIENLK